MRKLFVMSLTALLLLSCEKQQDPPLEPGSYFPLEIGNYWVYSLHEIDGKGVESPLNRIDSVVVVRDTLVQGERYFILEGNNYPHNNGRWMQVDVLRDSSGYFVDLQGRIRLSGSNFSDKVAEITQMAGEDSLYTLVYRMERESGLYGVPAGDFEVLNCKGTVTAHVPTGQVDYPRYLDNRYARGVGPVMNNYFYFHSPITGERRLLRYGTAP